MRLKGIKDHIYHIQPNVNKLIFTKVHINIKIVASALILLTK